MHVAECIAKFASYLFGAATFKLPVVAEAGLQQFVLDASSTSPGMDLWSYDDFKLLPLHASGYLAALLT